MSLAIFMFSEEVMKEVGEESVQKWKEKGGEGSLVWWKGKMVGKQEWKEMVQKEKEKRRETARAVQARKKEMMEAKKAEKEKQKRDEQAKKMAEAQIRSRDRHRRILMRAEGVGSKRGGTFEAQWMRGKECWKRTEKPRGRHLLSL